MDGVCYCIEISCLVFTNLNGVTHSSRRTRHAIQVLSKEHTCLVTLNPAYKQPRGRYAGVHLGRFCFLGGPRLPPFHISLLVAANVEKLVFTKLQLQVKVEGKHQKNCVLKYINKIKLDLFFSRRVKIASCNFRSGSLRDGCRFLQGWSTPEYNQVYFVCSMTYFPP